VLPAAVFDQQPRLIRIYATGHKLGNIGEQTIVCGYR
jgi:hypothetical protein